MQVRASTCLLRFTTWPNLRGVVEKEDHSASCPVSNRNPKVLEIKITQRSTPILLVPVGDFHGSKEKAGRP